MALTVDFINPSGKSIAITNWTAYRVHQSFFIPADEFHLTLEDDRCTQLLPLLSIGQTCRFTLGKDVIMIGYIDSIQPSYSRGSGLRLDIKGRDYLGVLNDTHIMPNLNSGSSTTYQFLPTDTLTTVINRIIFGSQIGAPIAAVYYPFGIKDQDLTIGSDFGVGVKKGKGVRRGRLTAKKLSTSPLGHLLSPEKGETYLGYINRIIKRTGMNIKMFYVNGKQYVRCATPTYNYDEINDPGLVLKHDQTSNSCNVINAHPHIELKDQPSVIIAECYAGGPTFNRSTFKVVQVNELIGYVQGTDVNQLDIAHALPNVQTAINQLTNGNVNNTGSGTGYYVLPPNQVLYSQIPKMLIGIQTEFCRPMYIADQNSHTQEELCFATYKRMAEYQNKLFNAEYEVVGHSEKTSSGNTIPWTYDTMVNIQDNVFGFNGKFYIHEVSYMKDRQSGTRTVLGVHLPYIHSFGTGSDIKVYKNPKPVPAVGSYFFPFTPAPDDPNPIYNGDGTYTDPETLYPPGTT